MSSRYEIHVETYLVRILVTRPHLLAEGSKCRCVAIIFLVDLDPNTGSVLNLNIDIFISFEDYRRKCSTIRKQPPNKRFIFTINAIGVVTRAGLTAITCWVVETREIRGSISAASCDELGIGGDGNSE